MIVVTGTKRSGTSMWMQILIQAGFLHVGEAFPGRWEESIRVANPLGFYESRLRVGIYYATNPDPIRGEFLFPKQTKRHVVKIFIPGLVRTDYAFIDRVIATMRSWREYGPSLERLLAIERSHTTAQVDDSVLERPVDDARVGDPLLAQRRLSMPPWLEWWTENYDLIRDVATRRYPIHMLSYNRLLADPESSIQKVLGWLGSGDVENACSAVVPELRTQQSIRLPVQSPPNEFIEIFDELFDYIDSARPLTAAFIEALNGTNHRVLELKRELFPAGRVRPDTLV